MKINLTQATMGRQPGIYEVASKTADTLTLQDARGLFQVPLAATLPFDDEAARAPITHAPAPAPAEPPPPRFEVDEFTEATARSFYDNYCAAVGGVAFNGDPLPPASEFFDDPLPPASEFFDDPAKTKQANAYRVAMGMLWENVQVQDGDPEKPVSESTPGVIVQDTQADTPFSSLPEDPAPLVEDTPAPDATDEEE